MVKKEGKIPCNARVDMDYTKKKPEIKFGYTSKNPKKDAYNQNFVGIPLLLLILFLWLIPYLFVGFYEVPNKYPNFCNATVDSKEQIINTTSTSNYDLYNYHYSQEYNQVRGINVTCDGQDYYLKWGDSRFIYEKGKFKGDVKYNKFILYFLAIYFILLSPLLIYLINRFVTKELLKQKWYKKWIPEHHAGGKNKKKKYYKYKPNEVLENIIVIPKFSNVELTYNTKGDFSKYLSKIKIREYRQKTYKKGKVGKLEVDNFKWYAIFYFKQKPKTGYLEVFYQ